MIERDTPSANGRQEDLVLAITDVLLAGEGVRYRRYRRALCRTASAGAALFSTH